MHLYHYITTIVVPGYVDVVAVKSINYVSNFAATYIAACSAEVAICWLFSSHCTDIHRYFLRLVAPLG
jgi:hypothetical protein